MNWNDVKKIIRKEVLKEATTVNAGNNKFNIRTCVNKNPTKLGLKIQFEPLVDGLEQDLKSKLEVALQEKLNDSLKEYDIQVSKDTDVPRPEVIGFFIPLAQLKNLIVKSLTGKKVDAPDVKAPEPEGEEQEINEMILNAGIEVDTASDGSTFTVDLGTGVDPDVFVDGFDGTSAAAVVAQNPAAYQPVMAVANDNIDLKIVTLSGGAVTTGKFRIWALLMDCSDMGSDMVADEVDRDT